MKVEIDAVGRVCLVGLRPGDTFVDDTGKLCVVTDKKEPEPILVVELGTGHAKWSSGYNEVTPYAAKVVPDAEATP